MQETIVEATTDASCITAARTEAFARMTIGQRTYDIAEADDGAQLLFRTECEEKWMRLEHTRDDGWTKIAAEIVQSDPDVMDHFLSTHLVRVDGEFDAMGEVTCDLLGRDVRLRYDPTGLFVRVGGDWLQADTFSGDAMPLSGRARCHAALVRTGAMQSEDMSPAMSEWSGRIARGARVIPVL